MKRGDLTAAPASAKGFLYDLGLLTSFLRAPHFQLSSVFSVLFPSALAEPTLQPQHFHRHQNSNRCLQLRGTGKQRLDAARNSRQKTFRVVGMTSKMLFFSLPSS